MIRKRTGDCAFLMQESRYTCTQTTGAMVTGPDEM